MARKSLLSLLATDNIVPSYFTILTSKGVFSAILPSYCIDSASLPYRQGRKLTEGHYAENWLLGK